MRRFLLVLACVGVLVGCDQTPGPTALFVEGPRVAAFSQSTSTLLIGAGQPSVTAAVTLGVEVRAGDAPSATVEVRYAVVPQFGFTPVASGVLARTGALTFGAAVPLTFDRDDAGLYSIVVTATDGNGSPSNEVRGLLRVTLTDSGPPTITAIEGPTTFRPPGTLRLIAVATDPDGLGNLAGVTIRTPAGGVLSMFDDGTSQGDAVAGDGRYTVAFDVPAATPGDQTFTFQARDREGLTSPEVPFTVTILP